MKRRLSPSGRSPRRFLWRERLAGLWLARTEDRAKHPNLKEDGRERIERGGVAALGALHGNTDAERCLGNAVVQQDYAGDDFQRVTFEAVEDAFDVMDEDHGVFEGVEPVRADAGAEAKSSEHAGQASDVYSDAEIAAQQRAGVGPISGQFAGGGLLRVSAAYDLESGVAGAMHYANTPARSRIQTCRRDPGPPIRSDASACAHGAQCVRPLPERRSQIFPQRSQYFSSMVRIFDVAVLVFIVPLPLNEKHPATGRRRRMRESDSGMDRAIAATGLDCFAMTCL